MARNYIDPDKFWELVSMLRTANMSIQDIMQFSGISRRTVYRWLKAAEESGYTVLAGWGRPRQFRLTQFTEEK